MLDLFHLDPSDPRVQVFFARGGTNSADYQEWVKPRGIDVVLIFASGGGGGGGGGLTGGTGTARGGGSGGGSASMTRVTYPAFLIPDVLWVLPAIGGAAGVASGAGGSPSNTFVSVLRPSGSASLHIADAGTGNGGAAGTTTTNSGGSGSAALGLLQAPWFAEGVFVSTAGVAGGAGGAGTGANAGTAVTAFASQVLTGGAGGASTPTANTNAIGGAITAAGLLEADRAGGAVAGGAGQDGLFSLSPFWSTGGSGGGSNGAATGGAGGAGGYGSGGGGGGGGVTGGAGGRGGDGLVIIVCW